MPARHRLRRLWPARLLCAVAAAAVAAAVATGIAAVATAVATAAVATDRRQAREVSPGPQFQRAPSRPCARGPVPAIGAQVPPSEPLDERAQ